MCCSRRCRALRLPGTLQGQGRILIMLVLRRTAPRLQRGWWRTPRMAFMAMRSPLRRGQYRIYAKHLRESRRVAVRQHGSHLSIMGRGCGVSGSQPRHGGRGAATVGTATARTRLSVMAGMAYADHRCRDAAPALTNFWANVCNAGGAGSGRLCAALEKARCSGVGSSRPAPSPPPTSRPLARSNPRGGGGVDADCWYRRRGSARWSAMRVTSAAVAATWLCHAFGRRNDQQPCYDACRCSTDWCRGLVVSGGRHSSIRRSVPGLPPTSTIQVWHRLDCRPRVAAANGVSGASTVAHLTRAQ